MTTVNHNNNRRHYRPQIMTARKVENLTQTRRAEEDRVKVLLKYKNESQRLINAIKNESQMSLHCNNNSNDRTTSCHNSNNNRNNEQKKQEMERQDKLRREMLAKKEEEEKMEEVKRAEALRKEQIEREIQRICGSSEELKELERHIKIAYVNKERSAQHQEALLMKNIDYKREELIEHHMEEQMKAMIKQEESKENMRRGRLVAQKIQLQEQMRDENEVKLELARKEALKDKEIIDQILAKVNEEERVGRQKKDKKNLETKEMINAYQNESEKHKQVFAKQEKEHEDKINEYNKMMCERQEECELHQQKIEDDRKKAWRKVADETQNFNRSRDDYNALRDMLWEEERHEREKKEEEEMMKQRQQLKEQLLYENIKQIEAKKEMTAKMEEEGKQMVKKMLEKFAADEEDEREKQRMSLQAKKLFVEGAQRQRQERNRMFKEEREMQHSEFHNESQREEYRRKIIEEAKRQLLEKNAPQLKGFLPKLGT